MYKRLCTFLGAIVIVLIVVNFTALLFLKIRNSGFKDYMKLYLKKAEVADLLKTYEDYYTIEKIYEIRKESYRVLKSVYEPWTILRERPYSGKWTNVTEEGYRLDGRGRKDAGDKRKKIFVFGGSTTFGYGVADEDTIPACMQKALPEFSVFNYGRAFYYSTMELQLFFKLLKEGSVPDIAVFIDGLNDARALTSDIDIPPYSPALEKILNGGFYIDPDRLPILMVWIMAENAIKRMLLKDNEDGAVYDESVIERRSDASVNHYKQNREVIRRIADYYGVKVYFVWQPVPHYGYDLRNHLFKEPEHTPQNFIYRIYNGVYPKMQKDRPPQTIWLADMFRDKKYVYIDMHHYNPVACAAIAGRIVEVIRKDRLIK